jgi:hypothetical protein
MRKPSLKIADVAPTINTAAALELLSPLFDEVRKLIQDAATADRMRIEALLDGLLSILNSDQSASAAPADLAEVAGKALALIDMLAQFLPEASEDLPLFKKVSRRIDDIERLLGKREAVTQAGAGNEASESVDVGPYGEWACDVSYHLHELAYQAKAARALLRECANTEKDEALTGVSFLLTGLFEGLRAISQRVSETEFAYVHREQEASRG